MWIQQSTWYCGGRREARWLGTVEALQTIGEVLDEAVEGFPEKTVSVLRPAE